MPCWVRKWNLTQWRWPAALIMLKACEPKPCMCRKDLGMPRSLMAMVTWCSASGRLVQKSQLFSGAAQVGARVALDRVVEVGELQRVAEEEHRRVVADHVPVAFLGVELQREAADVALGVGRAALAGDGGEAGEHLASVADLG